MFAWFSCIVSWAFKCNGTNSSWDETFMYEGTQGVFHLANRFWSPNLICLVIWEGSPLLIPKPTSWGWKVPDCWSPYYDQSKAPLGFFTWSCFSSTSCQRVILLNPRTTVKKHVSYHPFSPNSLTQLVITWQQSLWALIDDFTISWAESARTLASEIVFQTVWSVHEGNDVGGNTDSWNEGRI